MTPSEQSDIRPCGFKHGDPLPESAGNAGGSTPGFYSDLTRDEAHERITKVLMQSQLKSPAPMVHLPVEAITAEQILDALGWRK